MSKAVLFFIFFVTFPYIVFGHQPREVMSTVTKVIDPEISKAYYGTLKGEPHLYQIDSTKDFVLYVGITVPQADTAETDFIFDIYEINTKEESNKLIESLSAPRQEWLEFYEPFAGDNYLSGPEYDEFLGSGEYEIVVYSPDNLGQYVLAIGKIESFPMSEIINTYKILPGIKTEYFNKPASSAFFNLMTFFLLAATLIILVTLSFLYKFVRKKFKDGLSPYQAKKQE